MNPHGWIVIDKPRGITSRDAVNQVQRWFPRGVPIGHTGTLDPLAEGVLVLAVGCATRLAEYVQAGRKVYLSDFHLGATSVTDDAEGPITAVQSATSPSRQAIDLALQRFAGEISQTPPAYSAAKVKGKRAYAEARAGRDVPLAARTVCVEAIHVLDYDYPRLRIEVRCGKGTYIRSLARDLGAALGCGAYVETLRRTRVGEFTADEASPRDGTKVRLLPLARGVATLPKVTLPDELIHRLRNGQFVRLDDAMNGEVAVFGENSDVVAIATANDGVLRPTKVLNY